MVRPDYAMLVRERIEEEIPNPKRRDDCIRELPEPQRFNLVHIITGMRRCGKTFYLFQLMQGLFSDGLPRELAFYFDFADDRLKPMDADVLDQVVNEYWRQVPEAREKGCYLFLDEVQEAHDWQGVCQRLAEHENVTLVITGSSSKVSSSEIATSFRGRSHVHEMWPLSFAEYCVFNGIALPNEGQRTYSPKVITRLEAAYDDYLLVGGFPAVQRMSSFDRIEVLQGYVRDVVARDVAERSGREDVSLAMQIALYGLRNTACEFSVNELSERLNELGYKSYWQKANGLVTLLREAYLIHYLQEFTTMLKPSSTSLPKVYAEDQGLVYAVSRVNQQDIGKRFETAIYLELRRRNAGRRTDVVTSLNIPDADNKKIDFVIGDALGEEPYGLYQVCADMTNAKTRKREIGSLEAAMKYAKLTQGTIITLKEEDSIQVSAGIIDVVPAWKWSLAKMAI